MVLVVERMDLTRQYGKDPQRRWRSGGLGSPYERIIVFGRLADGRWYADAGGYELIEPDGRTAYVFAATDLGHTLALRLAYRWMTELGGHWTPIPASYDGSGKPADGLPWIPVGREWVLPK